jgi:hypothetical protein
MTKLQDYHEEYPTAKKVLTTKKKKKKKQIAMAFTTLGLQGHIQSTGSHLPMSKR